ncbi:Cleavage and polyadenylation specificity factor subunit 6, partial [Cladochytrium tenue]
MMQGGGRGGGSARSGPAAPLPSRERDFNIYGGEDDDLLYSADEEAGPPFFADPADRQLGVVHNNDAAGEVGGLVDTEDTLKALDDGEPDASAARLPHQKGDESSSGGKNEYPNHGAPPISLGLPEKPPGVEHARATSQAPAQSPALLQSSTAVGQGPPQLQSIPPNHQPPMGLGHGPGVLMYQQGPQSPAILLENLTWWTTDEDIIEACRAGGVADDLLVSELTFAEHRVNGKSKGAAFVLFKTSAAAAEALRLFQRIEIHGRIPQVSIHPLDPLAPVNPFRNTIPSIAVNSLRGAFEDVKQHRPPLQPPGAAGHGFPPTPGAGGPFHGPPAGLPPEHDEYGYWGPPGAGPAEGGFAGPARPPMGMAG